MKIKIGLNSLVVAKLTEDVSAALSEEGTASVTYDEIVPLPNVQNIDFSPKTQTADVDADDVTTTLIQCSGADGNIQRTMFTPEEEAMLLDKTVLEDGTIVSTGDDNPAYFAIGFRQPIYGGGLLCMWILRAKFTEGDFAAETKGTEKLNPQSDKLSFKSATRMCDNAWRVAKVVQSEEEIGDFFTIETLQKLYKKTSAPAVVEEEPEEEPMDA